MSELQEPLVYIDGNFVPKSEARISVFDHGVLYGDGVFEGIRLYKKNIFRMQQHMDRLWDSAHAILLDIPMSKEELTEATAETCRRNGLVDGYIRLVVTRGEGTLGLDPFKCPKPTIFIIAASIQLYPREFYEKGLSVITAAQRRIAPDTFSARVKSLNYLNNIMAKVNALKAGVLEAFMLTQQGYILEATGDNVFLVRDGVLYTPPTYMGALRGITRDAVLDLARKRGIEIREEPFTQYEVYTADECFLTGTAAEVIPVTEADSRPIGDGKPGTITRQLIEDFHSITAVEGVRI